MAIVGGLDLHRKQVTFDVVDTATGACERGRIAPANRDSFRRWLAGFEGQLVDLAVEGCTGWRFVVEECRAAGVHAHLAEPAEVAGLKGRRQHAKTDRLDARHLRELLEAGKLPECWIPPHHVLEIRARYACIRIFLRSAAAGSNASMRLCSISALPRSPTCSDPTRTGWPDWKLSPRLPGKPLWSRCG
jgi:transposase